MENEERELYFARTAIAKIYHDSPVIGAFSVGGEQGVCIGGPFDTKKEAKEYIKKRKESVDHEDTNFYAKIIQRIVPNDSENKKAVFCKLYRTYQRFSVDPKEFHTYEQRIEFFRDYYLNPRIKQFKEEKVRFEQRKIKDRFFDGFEIVIIMKNRGETFSELKFNGLGQVKYNSPPFAYNTNQRGEIQRENLNLYFGPSMTLTSLSYHANEKDEIKDISEILLSDYLDFIKCFDSGLQSIEEILGTNKNKIIIM